MSTHLLILSISLFSIIICENIEMWSNNYFYLFELKDDETIFQLEVDDPKDNEKMKIELFLSHPSSYKISFNYTDEKKEEEEEGNVYKEEEIEEKETIEEDIEEKPLKEEEILEEEIIKEYDERKKEEIKEIKEEDYEEIDKRTKEDEEQIEEETLTKIKINKERNISQNNLEKAILYLYENNFFEKSLRKLYEYPNNLIEFEEDFSSKKTLILKLNKNITMIHLIIKKIKHIPKEITSFCYLKYQISEKNFKNYKFENNLTATLINRNVLVSFKGIVPIGENIIDDFEVEYNAYLYRKQDQYEYENINHKFLPNRYIAQSGSKKITNTNERNYDLILSGNEQNGKEQWLEVIAEVKYGDDRECFIYNLTLVDVEYKNGVKPDDNSGNNTNQDNINDDEDDFKFYLIITIFAGVIILIFVIVFVVTLKRNAKHDIEDEESDNLINKMNFDETPIN